MEEVKQPAIRVFFSYAHEDASLRDELEKHLGSLKRQGYITNWHDRDISAGKEWKHEIDKNLSESDIVLLLVSPDFIHSAYCYGIEMNVALEKHATEEARAIPIILRPVDWEDAPFSHLRALPTDAKPITTWLNRDEAFLDVTKGIRKVVKELLVEKYLGMAEELYDEDQLEKVLILCERAIRLDPTAYKAYRLKMELLIDLERYEEALMVFQQAIDLIPNDADLYKNKADILINLNRHEEALDALEKAIELEPLESERYSSKGHALFSLGRYKEALDCYQQAIDIVSPDGEWVYSKEKGEALFELGRYEEATSAYSMYIEVVPDGDEAAEALKCRGDAFCALGRYEEALASYLEAEKELEEYYGGTENSDFRDEAPSCIKGEGDALLKLGRYEEALAAYQRAIDLAPETSGYYEDKGDILHQLARYEEALVAFDCGIRLAPGTFTAYNKKAMTYEQLRKKASRRAIEIQYDTQVLTVYEGSIDKVDYHYRVADKETRKFSFEIMVHVSSKSYLLFHTPSHDVRNLGSYDIVTIYLSEENMQDSTCLYIDNHTQQKYGIKLPLTDIGLYFHQ